MSDPYAGIAVPIDPYAGIAQRVGVGQVAGGQHLGSNLQLTSPSYSGPPMPRAQPQSGPQPSVGQDVVSTILPSMLRGATAFAGQVGDTREMVANLATWAMQKFGVGHQDAQTIARGIINQSVVAKTPTSGQINQGVENVTGPLYHPRTGVGRYVDAGLQFATGAGLGGGVEGGVVPTMQRLGVGALSGVASQGSSDVAGSVAHSMHATPEQERAWRLAAGLAGGVIPGALMGMTVANSDPVSEQIGRHLPEEVDVPAVQAMRQRNQAVGFPTTLAEATDYTTGGASRLTGLQQNIEGRPPGIEELGPMMAERPEQGRRIMAQVLAGLGPEQPPANIALNAQDAAQEVLRRAEQARTFASGPMYRADAARQVDPQALASVIRNMDQTIAEEAPSLTRPLQAFRDELTSPGPLTVGRVSGMLGNPEAVTRRLLGADAPVDRQQIGILGPYIDQVDALVTQPGSFRAAGNDIHRNFSQVVNDPLEAGQIGKIAAPLTAGSEPRVEAQMGALYPNNPLSTQAGETRQTVGMLGQPGADLTRAYLDQQQGKYLGRLATGPNSFGPSRLAAALSGNENQRDNLLAGVGAASPRSAQVLSEGLDAFNVAGMRQRPGSNTADKLSEAIETAGEKFGVAAIAKTSERAFLDRLRNVFADLRLEFNQRQIANALIASPEEGSRILQRALAAKGDTIASRAIRQSAINWVEGNSRQQDQGQ